MPTCFPFPRSLLALLDDEPKLILRVCCTVGNSSEVLVGILQGHGQTSFNNVGTRTGPERRTQQTRRPGRREGVWLRGKVAPSERVAGRSRSYKGGPGAADARGTISPGITRSKFGRNLAQPPVHRVGEPFIFSLRLVTEESPGAGGGPH